MPVETVGSPALWGGFVLLILILLGADLGVFRRQATEMSLRSALKWTGVWISLAALFNSWVWVRFGGELGKQFTAGYLVEEALSVDNVFVFSVVLTFFGVPRAFQQRVLFWGILGAMALRAVFIGVAAGLLEHFHWMAYVFGGILIYTAIKLLFHDGEEVDPSRNILVRLARRVLPVTDGYRGHAFFVVEAGRFAATPLLVVLVAIESTDVVFAVDSIPAIFGIAPNMDPFIVYTSNIFAILGLRSLYFVVAGMMDKFHYLKVALSGILAFIGVKMLVVNVMPVPVTISLIIIAATLAVAILASLWRANRLERQAATLAKASDSRES